MMELNFLCEKKILGGLEKRTTFGLNLPVLILNEEKKLTIKFYFHYSLWSFKRFYKGLKDFHKTF